MLVLGVASSPISTVAELDVSKSDLDVLQHYLFCINCRDNNSVDKCGIMDRLEAPMAT